MIIEEVEKADVIINIFLNFPEELNLKDKLSAILEKDVYTLDARTISMESAGANDNGLYVFRGYPKKFYMDKKETYKGENGQ